MMNLFNRTATLSLLAAGCMTALWQASAAANPATTGSKGFGVYVNVEPAATVNLSASTFTWNSMKTTVQGYVAADNAPITVTGSIRTSPGGGSGSIVVLSPGDIPGTAKNATLPIDEFAVTCSGSGNSGTAPAYAPPLTPLKANAAAPCASWGPGASTRLSFNLGLYLQTHAVQKSVYQSDGFSVIATAT